MFLFSYIQTRPNAALTVNLGETIADRFELNLAYNAKKITQCFIKRLRGFIHMNRQKGPRLVLAHIKTFFKSFCRASKYAYLSINKINMKPFGYTIAEKEL